MHLFSENSEAILQTFSRCRSIPSLWTMSNNLTSLITN